MPLTRDCPWKKEETKDLLYHRSMSNFERSFDFNPSRNPEHELGGESGAEREKSVDLRMESELFQDHERVDSQKDIDDKLARLRDTLTEDYDGIIHLDIPEYRYDFGTNPFVGTDAQRRRTYAISRYLDVVFMHRFMYQNVIVCGLQSRKFVDESHRGSFVKQIRERGGIPIEPGVPYDILGQPFTPLMTSSTVTAMFYLYHKQTPRSEERPQYPLDIWLVYDMSSYQSTDGSPDFRQAYTLHPGADRQTSLLGLAQIN